MSKQVVAATDVADGTAGDTHTHTVSNQVTEAADVADGTAGDTRTGAHTCMSPDLIK
jgi:hypothetical protein